MLSKKEALRLGLLKKTDSDLSISSHSVSSLKKSFSTEPIILTIEDLKIIPKERPRFFDGKVKTSQKTLAFEKIVRDYGILAMRGHSPFECPLEVFIDMVFPIPQSWSNKMKILASQGLLYPTSKPDMDNAMKAILDSLNGVVYRDDALIVSSHETKRYGEKSKISLKICPLSVLGSTQASQDSSLVRSFYEIFEKGSSEIKNKKD